MHNLKEQNSFTVTSVESWSQKREIAEKMKGLIKVVF